MIQLDIRSRTKHPTPSVVRNPTPTPPENLRLLRTATPAPTPQPWFIGFGLDFEMKLLDWTWKPKSVHL